MLVLSRRLNEMVLLPNLEITIRVLKLRGKSVVLGITAPDGVRITRSSSDDLTGLKPADGLNDHRSA